jgi:hypothetical protein
LPYRHHRSTNIASKQAASQWAAFVVCAKGNQMTVQDTETTKAEEILGQPPIQIRLHESFGNLPKDISLLLPRRFALRLIRKRLGVPVAELDALADAELTAEDLIDMGFTETQIA